MCGRYFLNIELDKLANRYNINDIPDELINYQGEIFPSNDAPVVYNDKNKKKIGLMNWGFRTSYSNNLVINARSETVHKKNLFKESFHTRRCIIPVTGFYEWKNVNDKKEKYFINIKKKEYFSLAGIYDFFNIGGNERMAFTILTKEAPKELINIHERIPVIIQKDEEKEWLENKFTPRIFDYLTEKDLEFEAKTI
ncbi:MAG: SOS response-associated peptidase [Halanaerobiales bacterium]|nr:SOS response-associated peptidase [Halanaerobiales bacterium]